MFKPNGQQPQEFHTELPINIQVQGGYHQVGSFLAELANLRRIVTVSNLRLATNLKSGDDGTTTADFTASAYSLNTAPVVTTPAPSTDAKKGDNHGRKS